MHVDGEDLTSLPLIERKKRLERVVKGSGILIFQVLPGSAQQVIDAVGRLGLEGVIAKRKDSIYKGGLRTPAWVKLKLDKQQEFVIGGYRPGDHGIDALLVGYYDRKKLRFGGKVRAGFTPHLRRDVFGRIKGLEINTCPLSLPDLRLHQRIDSREVRKRDVAEPRRRRRTRRARSAARHDDD